MLEQFNKSLDFRINTLYTGLHGMFWMLVCCTISLGSAYLSNRGYSIFSIGLLFAVAYLLAAFAQQIVSVLTDNSTEFDVLDVLAVFGVAINIDLFIALFTHGNSFWTGITFLFAAMITYTIQPFLNALNFHIERYGVDMNYGFARASGSFAFFIMSLIAGFFMKITSVRVVIIFGFLVSIGFTALIIWIFRELKATGIKVKNDYDPFEHDSSDAFDTAFLKDFVEKYRMFFLFLIGVMCFFFSHVISNNFLYQIVVNVGGDEATNGGIMAVMAIVELPAMIFFSRLRERFGTKLLLGVSAVFFLIKIFFTAISTTVPMLYFSMLFQCLAFALFIPASVYFVDEIMTKKDAVKGQAFVTIAMTFSSLIGSILGGLIINLLGVNAALWFAFVVTFVGVVVGIYSLFRINTQK